MKWDRLSGGFQAGGCGGGGMGGSVHGGIVARAFAMVKQRLSVVGLPRADVMLGE